MINAESTNIFANIETWIIIDIQVYLLHIAEIIFISNS